MNNYSANTQVNKRLKPRIAVVVFDNFLTKEFCTVLFVFLTFLIECLEDIYLCDLKL